MISDWRRVMKKSKVLLIIQAIAMYLIQVPFVIFIILFYLDLDTYGEIIWPLILTGILLNLVMVPICIINGVFAIIGIFKKRENPFKLTMIIKLALIPWYAINFFMGFIFTAATLNPFLLWSAAFIIAIMACTTYIYMISTSLPAYSYILYKVTRREWKINKVLVWSFILMAFFCLDAIGSIILFINFRNKEVEENTQI